MAGDASDEAAMAIASVAVFIFSIIVRFDIDGVIRRKVSVL